MSTTITKIAPGYLQFIWEEVDERFEICFLHIVDLDWEYQYPKLNEAITENEIIFNRAVVDGNESEYALNQVIDSHLHEFVAEWADSHRTELKEYEQATIADQARGHESA